MQKKTKALLSALIVTSVMMFFVGCGKESTDTIKIGGLFPLSGPVAVYGIEARNGVEMAIEEINAAGGINGKQVVLISEDDEGNAEKTVNAYKKLTTKDGVKYIIGSLTSGCTAAITSLAQAQKVVMMLLQQLWKVLLMPEIMFSEHVLLTHFRELLVENFLQKT